MTNVFIAAPTPMMRAGLRAMLETADLSAGSGQALRVVGEVPSLADVSGELQGVDVLIIADELLLDETARTAVGNGQMALVLLSNSEQSAGMLRTLPLRSWSIVPPDASSAELQAAVASAAQGLVVLSMPIAERLLSMAVSAPRALDTGELEEPLTARELEVLALVSQGLSNKLIARKLGISEHTVKFHVSAIYTKLGAASRTEAVSHGARHGLISF